MRGRALFLILCLCFLPGLLEAQVPVSNFSSDVTSGCVTLVVKFNDLSTNNPTSWKWDLGNGAISTNQNPQTTYSTPGTYAVTLTATNASGSNTITRTGYIQVYALPTVNFKAADTVGCNPLTVNFNDASNANSGSISSWQWNFGDGGTSTSPNQLYTYTGAGAYGVILKVTNSFGCSATAIKSEYIKVGTPIRADFISTTKQLCTLPVTVDFLNGASTSGNMTYNWKFGDGTFSSDVNPSHSYTSYGSFNVTMVAVSDGGCRDSITKTIAISKSNVEIVGSDSVCAVTPAKFKINSANKPNSLLWQMGDLNTYTTDSITHTYNNAGTYIVKLIATFANCSDTISKMVVASPLPTANFSSASTTSCKIPSTVSFQNSSPATTSWLWDFGDGNTSSLQNPTHTYTNEGNYAVTLTAASATGCTTKITKTDFVKIQRPVVKFSNVPSGGCVPYTFSPEYTVESVDPIVSYLWDFGDGTSSTLGKPTHTYTAVGAYTVKLLYKTSTGCEDSLIVTNGVLVGDKIAVDFSVSEANLCGKENVFFTSKVPQPVRSFEWSFGDSTSSIFENPVHRYTDTGFYSVMLTVDRNGCKSSAIKYDYVYVGGTISKPEFEKDCTQKGKVLFKNKSINGNTYLWDFGDGATSTDMEPEHIYLKDSNYSVLLVSTDTTGCADSTILIVPVWLGGIDVIASTDSICKNERVILTLVHPMPTSVTMIFWDFGNETNALSAANPIGVRLNTVGNYNITTITTDQFGCKDTVYKPNLVRVSGPVANFKANSFSGCSNTEISFDDLSTTDGLHSIKKWDWNFGDGKSETNLQPPFKHIYSNQGTFDVSLKVTDASGCSDSATQQKLIFISEVKADFVSLDSFSCEDRQVAFRNLGTSNIASYFWDFGDGSTSTLSSPSHLYSDTGLYSVKLRVTSTSGCADSLIKTNYVTIKNPTAKFGFSNPDNGCAPIQINFYDSSYYAKSWLWEFGDGKTSTFKNPSHAFFTPSNYNVKLTVTSPGGCQATYNSLLNVTGPVGTFSYTPLSACENNNSVTFKATAKGLTNFSWDFNDGTIISGKDSLIIHSYKTPGSFIPKVILKDSTGCSLSLDGMDTIFIEGATAYFGSDKKVVCENDPINFFDSSTFNAAINYSWDFGDGNTSLLKNPQHIYTSAGNYNVQLITTTQNGCSDTVSFNNYVRVAKKPVVKIIGDAESCVPAIIGFSSQLASDTSSIIDWQWNFGNGSTSSLKDPPLQQFNKEGTYENFLTVTNSSGCTASDSSSILIHPVPQIVNIDTTICRGDSVQLFATGSSNFYWTPALNLSCADCSNPVASPLQDQVYKLNATSTFKCANADSIIIKVLQPFNVSVANPVDTICIGDVVQLQAFGTSKYLWTPSATLSANNIANPLATTSGNITYNVVGYDTLGCFTDSATSSIVVYSYPAVELAPDIVAVAGTTKNITPVYTGNISNYSWTPAKDLSCYDCPNPVVSVSGNTTYRLKVSNEGGCSAEDFFKIIVTCDNSTVFVPNTFSPNGDGMNDVFYPRGNGMDNISSMVIINRWGEAVFNKRNFTANNASVGWDGMYKGRRADAGVYSYIMEIICKNGQVLNFIGNITLIQ